VLAALSGYLVLRLARPAAEERGASETASG
jgi:hypothetical protein